MDVISESFYWFVKVESPWDTYPKILARKVNNLFFS